MFYSRRVFAPRGVKGDRRSDMTEEMVAERGRPWFSLRGWPRPWVRRGGQVTLNDAVSWDLSIRGGVAHLDADLRGLRVEAIEVSHGASRLDLRLPRPSGVVPVRIAGGAAHVQVSTEEQPGNQEVVTP
jgi:hypothetical protein